MEQEKINNLSFSTLNLSATIFWNKKELIIIMSQPICM